MFIAGIMEGNSWQAGIPLNGCNKWSMIRFHQSDSVKGRKQTCSGKCGAHVEPGSPLGSVHVSGVDDCYQVQWIPYRLLDKAPAMPYKFLKVLLVSVFDLKSSAGCLIVEVKCDFQVN